MPTWMDSENMKITEIVSETELSDVVDRALREDIGRGDLTTKSLVADSEMASGRILSRGSCIVCGIRVATLVFQRLDPKVKVKARIADGGHAGSGDTIATVTGPARAILSGERTALNFLQRLSGIATLTRRFVSKVKPYGVVILDTRKTTPTLRTLEKYAVLCGGGCNHRMGLYDMVLIKDNHLRLWKKGHAARRFGDAVATAKKRYPGVPVEVEVENIAQLAEVLRSPPDWVLLDNMPSDVLKRCVALCRGKTKVEASGGITLDTVEAVARTGVDAISLGCLTHSAPAVDLSLELD